VKEEMRQVKKQKGQSTVEYVIVFTAIAAAIIFAAVSIIKPAVNKTYGEAGNSIEKGANYFGNRVGFGFNQ
jgi:Flp pilus assembly pilin Flp